MIRFFANDEQGVVTIDWVALTAGLVLLGVMVVYAVMGNSADGLLNQFDQLNDHFEANAIILADAVKLTDFGK